MKWQKVLQKDRKHCGKRRNCLFRAISPFPMLFSKDFYRIRMKTRACLGKGEPFTTQWQLLTYLKVKNLFEKIVGKAENSALSPFPAMFFFFYGREIAQFESQ